MNHNVYLPDTISQRAKAAGLNLSGLLRTAVEDALERSEALDRARDGMTEQNVDLDDRNGDPLRLRFTGKSVGGIDPEIYLTDEGKVVIVHEDGYDTFDGVDEFSDWAADPFRNNLGREGEESVGGALQELGARRVIDL